MEVYCEICKKNFKYPFEQIKHRHVEYELDLVPPNYWRIKDTISDEFKITIQDSRVIRPETWNRTDLKAGNTPLFKHSYNVYVKDESCNPLGSFKDRGMDCLMHEVKKCGKDKIAVVSCGSGAISVVNYAKQYGIESYVFVHKGISKDSLALLSKADNIFFSANFIESYIDYMKYSLSHTDVFWGFLNTNLSYMIGLRSMAYEIVANLGKAPDTVFIPCGSGMDIIAQNFAFNEMYRNGIINKIPKIGIVEITGGNPISQGYKKGIKDYSLYVIENPVDSKTILSNDTCFNYKGICDIVSKEEGFFTSVSDAEIDDFLCENAEYGKKYDYSSLSAMAAYKKYNKKADELIVIVMTSENRSNHVLNI